MRSPSRTSASGPPAAASGETCSTTVPNAVPLMRASEMRTMSLTPRAPSFFGIGSAPASGMPGAPIGPALRSTRQCSGVTGRSGSSIRCARSSSESNTSAGPWWLVSALVAAASLMRGAVRRERAGEDGDRLVGRHRRSRGRITRRPHRPASVRRCRPASRRRRWRPRGRAGRQASHSAGTPPAA